MSNIDAMMVEAHELTKIRTAVIENLYDENDNPRQCDDASIMACYHDRYLLGDPDGPEKLDDALTRALMAVMEQKHPVAVAEGYSLGDEEIPDEAGEYKDNPFYCEDVDDKVEKYHEHEDAVPAELKLLILPLYLYDHSGITMSTGSFSCSWDSGQVGWIFTTASIIQHEWDGDWEHAERYLKGDVQTYSHYIEGAVYGFTVWEHEDTEHYSEGEEIDACWGFYGYDHKESGLMDTLLSHDVLEENIIE